MEAPLAALEVMAPYVVATHLRDTMVWEYESGAQMQWCALGDGLLDWPHFVRRLSQLCPQVPVHFEIISGSNSDVPYLKPGFWDVWPKARAADFSGFLALARRGKPRDSHAWPEDKAERGRNNRVSMVNHPSLRPKRRPPVVPDAVSQPFIGSFSRS